MSSIEKSYYIEMLRSFNLFMKVNYIANSFIRLCYRILLLFCRHRMLEDSATQFKHDGLSTLIFNPPRIEKHHLFTKILVPTWIIKLKATLDHRVTQVTYCNSSSSVVVRKQFYIFNSFLKTTRLIVTNLSVNKLYDERNLNHECKGSTTHKRRQIRKKADFKKNLFLYKQNFLMYEYDTHESFYQNCEIQGPLALFMHGLVHALGWGQFHHIVKMY